MEKSLVILLLLCSLSTQAQYRITRAKLAGWGVLALAGVADGMVEGYEFDQRKSFERKYNVSKTGYFGSQSWKSAYRDGIQANGFKSGFVRTFGVQDFYHHADDLRKLGYMSGGIVIGINGTKTNSKKWYYIIDFAASMAISAATKSISMRWIRS